MKIGVQVALINYNLRLNSLVNSIKASQAKILVVGTGEDLQEAVLKIIDDIDDVKVYTNDGKTPYLYDKISSFTDLVETASEQTPDRKLRSDVTIKSTCFLIYTSGTTGLPKPAIVTQLKSILFAHFFVLYGVGSEEIIYEPLPLYHTAGSMLGIGFAIAKGATVVLRSKFSASHFWEDCRKYNVTLIHYVGEMCRYLTSRPKTDNDQVHNVKIAIGNGLRTDVWTEFVDRFRIPTIGEFYGATELPVGFINVLNKFGSCGRSSPFLRKLIPCAFIKVDMTTQEPIRNSSGRCVPCNTGETGLLLVKMTKVQEFVGYRGREKENEKKILHDVFVKGDQYVNSGDLFRIDDDYNLYFSDRLGDTFRWKGENVSTTEVSSTLSELGFIHDAVVYGVNVPGCEGRAGMACLCLKEPDCKFLNEKQLHEISIQVNTHLPSYARPLFIRIQSEIDLTGTFKQKKARLVQEAFDINKIQHIYYLPNSESQYTLMTNDIYQKIFNGNMF